MAFSFILVTDAVLQALKVRIYKCFIRGNPAAISVYSRGLSANRRYDFSGMFGSRTPCVAIWIQSIHSFAPTPI